MMAPDTGRSIEDEAMRWVARMDRHDWAPEQEVELALWLDSHPRARGALLRAEAAWVAPDLVRDETAFAARVAVAERPHRRHVMIAGASTLAASCAGAMLWFKSGTRYHTAVGEILRVSLADGSTAAINTDSRLSVAMSRSLRRIRLDRGEAWFQVKHDKARPFLVEAGDVRVRAVGTAFSVRRREEGVEILVTEGVVAVWLNGTAAAPISGRAGMRLFVPDNATIQRTDYVETAADRSLSWRNGQIELNGQTLRSAAAEFNRYNSRQIVIADAAIADEQVDGVFRTNDPEGFANAVQHVLGVPVDLSHPGQIAVGRRR